MDTQDPRPRWPVAAAAMATAGIVAAAAWLAAPAAPELARPWAITAATAALAAGLAVAIAGSVLRGRGDGVAPADLVPPADPARADAPLQTRAAVILGLAKLAESRDDATGQHLDRIRRYVRLLGEALVGRHPEIDREFVETIVETSALHDIGKVGIPDHVLLKPGLLTEEQREIVKKHTLIGGDTLLAVKRRWGDDQFLVTACEIVFAHHEHYDGTGYPFGLAGEMIPLAARIVAVADVYDALTNARVYKDAMPHPDAVRVIEEGRGSHFDPLVVDAFMTRSDAFRRVAEEFEGREPEPLTLEG